MLIWGKKFKKQKSWIFLNAQVFNKATQGELFFQKQLKHTRVCGEYRGEEVKQQQKLKSHVGKKSGHVEFFTFSENVKLRPVLTTLAQFILG